MAAAVQAGSPGVTVEQAANYQDWGWDAVVVDNGLVTTAVVPVIGARVMQFDLGENVSIFVNEEEMGKVYPMEADTVWRNYGGFKNWPAPQNRWNWPPPTQLDRGVYEVEVRHAGPDSAVVFCRSPLEEWRTPGLVFERTLTLYRGSARMKVDQTVVNHADTAQHWSMWEITQKVVHHPGQRDFANYWVYFPLNPASRYGEQGVYGTGLEAFRGEVAPEVGAVEFMPLGAKVFADSHQGWLCYVDERDGYAYARTFALEEEGQYPDDGAVNEVWVSADPLYLEIEVVSPIVELAPDGGRYTFTQDWWAARVKGPIVAVNEVGALANRLAADSSGVSLKAGVFHVGTARLVQLNDNGQVVEQGPVQPVTPLATYVLDEGLVAAEGAARAEVWVWDEAGELVGSLDGVDLD